jgi:uncharacterized protein (DUF362 family)/ferredoxin
MADVWVDRCPDYEPDRLREILTRRLDAMLYGRIGAGTRVLIKPNLLLPARPDTGILTHPAVVRAAAEYALDRGARVRIADSPAIGTFKRVLRVGGLAEALAGLDVELTEFRETVRVRIGEPFGEVELAREAVAADVIINLAKLKTHAQMRLTLGVKNLFGCVVGLQKPEWHMRSGVDRDLFATLLVRICRTLAPAATVVDGIIGLEGHGPGKGGTPRALGVLISGADAPAVDVAICRMVGLDPDRLPTAAAARRLGLLDDDGGTVIGDWREGEFGDFKLPALGPLTYGPRPMRRLMRRHLLQRPAVRPEACRVCGECVRYCPAEAITLTETAVTFDYDRCIRCYCCIEICPHGALRAVETLPGRGLRAVGGLFRRITAR